jgi:hypothetical protein
VASKECVRVRGKVWSEILDALEKVRPDIRSIIRFRTKRYRLLESRRNK